MTSPAPTGTLELDHIVHPTDLSTSGEAAFAHALRLAVGARSHFYLVHAEKLENDDDPNWAAFPGVRSTLARWGLLAADAEPADVEGKLGLRVTKADVPALDPTRAVLHFTEQNPCDLLVVATHAHEGGLTRLLQGSIAETLARRAKVPTLFLPVQGRGFVDPATGAVRLANVLLPVDGSTPSGAATSLALRLAEVLGVGMSVAVHLLHVGKAEEAAGGAAEATHDSRLRVIAKDGSSVTASVLDTAAEVDADLIVMATRGRDGLLDALLGTTTEQVLHQAGRALLAVPVA